MTNVTDKVDQLVKVTNDVGQSAKMTDDALGKLIRVNDHLFCQYLTRCSQKVIVIDGAVCYPKDGIGQFLKETGKLVLLEKSGELVKVIADEFYLMISKGCG